MANDPLTPIAIPRQAMVKEGYFTSQGVKLWYWDSGGDGDPIVLLHPATGSAAIWLYQQPVFIAAGYRVIAFSRRGHMKSDVGPMDAPGTGADDLHALVTMLELKKFHIVSSAAGSGVGIDYALSYPERLFSFTNGNGIGGPEDEAYSRMAASIRPKEFEEYPASFRELGPSYRAANPDGTKLWSDMEAKAVPNGRPRQGRRNEITKDLLAKFRVPTLLMSGDADLYMPPSMLRALAAFIPHAETSVIPESGHSAYWERPDIFNAIVLDFLHRHT